MQDHTSCGGMRVVATHSGTATAGGICSGMRAAFAGESACVLSQFVPILILAKETSSGRFLGNQCSVLFSHSLELVVLRAAKKKKKAKSGD